MFNHQDAKNAKGNKVVVGVLEVGVAGGWDQVVGWVGLEFLVADGVALGAGAEGAHSVGEEVGGVVGWDAPAVWG